MDAQEGIRFGEFQLWQAERQLKRGDATVRLTPKVFETLAFLVENSGRLVTKQELMDHLWPDSFVQESNLSWNIHELRKALGDDRRRNRYIETVPKLGFRFVADVAEPNRDAASAAHPTRGLESPEKTRKRQPARTSLVGRDAAFRVLREQLAAASRGSGTMVSVHGEPGIGKSSVVDAFLLESRSQSPPYQVAAGRCSRRLFSTEAYLPIMEALEHLLTQDEDGAARHILAKEAPSWCARVVPSLPGGADESPASTAESQQHLKREFLRCLKKLSCDRPLILSLDDLHWADEATTDLLSYLGDRLGELSVLVVSTHRDTELLLQNHPFVQVKQELESHRLCVDLPLALLSENNIEQYISQAFPEHQFPSAFSRVMFSRTEGSPLFLVDVLRYLAQRGVIDRGENGSWTLAQPLADVAKELPPSVRSMVERKIAQVSPNERSILDSASIQGSVFDSAVILDTAPIEPMLLEERLHQLEQVHGIIELLDDRVLPDDVPSLQYRFVHSLYQESLLDSLRPARKSELCGRVAESLAKHYRNSLSTVASRLGLLYKTARQPERAARFYLDAAKTAAKVFASKEALTLARSALEMTGTLPPSPRRDALELQSLTTLVGPLTAVAGFAAPEVERASRRAHELAGHFSSSPSVVPVLCGLGNYYFVKGEIDTADQVADELQTIADSSSDSQVRSVALAARGWNAHAFGRFADAVRHTESGIALYDADVERRWLMELHWSVGVALHAVRGLSLWMSGHRRAGIVSMNEAQRIALQVGHPAVIAYAQTVASWIYFYERDHARVGGLCGQAVAAAQNADLSLWLPVARAFLGWSIAARADDDGEGQAEMLEALTDYERTGAGLYLPFMRGAFAESCLFRGEFERGLEVLEVALSHANARNEHHYVSELHRLKGHAFMNWSFADHEADSSTVTVSPEASVRDAFDSLSRSLQLSSDQRAVPLMARASLSLAKWHLSVGQKGEGLTVLADFLDGQEADNLSEDALSVKTLLEANS